MKLSDQERAEVMGLGLEAYYKLTVADRGEALILEALKADSEAEVAEGQLNQKTIADMGYMYGDQTKQKRGSTHDAKLYNERNGGPRGKDTAAAEHFAVSTRTIRRQIDQWRRRKLLGRQAYLMLRD